MKISICIPAMSGTFLNEVIDSIEANSYQDYEIVISDSSVSGSVKEKVSGRDVQYVKADSRAGLLKGRYIAHIASSGDVEVLLDETRSIRHDALKIISCIQTDMATIAEMDVGFNLIGRLSNRDKKWINSHYQSAPTAISKGFLIPRVFERRLIGNAFQRIKSSIPPSTFDNIVYDDHEILYYECQKESNSISMIKDILIFHRTEPSYYQMFKKYYRYGRTANLLRRTPYEFVCSPKRHIRPSFLPWQDMPIALLMLMRGIPFYLGYCLSKDQ